MSRALLSGTKLHRDFQREIERGLSHAYLLVTPDSTAAHELFLMLAEEILLAENGFDSHAQIEEGTHPDVKFYENAGKLNVKEAGAITTDVYVKPIESKRKLYFLERSDGISAAVQNKLLKTYEEPPENVTVFISAASETSLLTTIRSRAKKFYLEAFSTRDLKEELLSMGADEKSAETVSLTAAGSLTDALRFAADGEFLKRYEETFELLMNLKKSSEIPMYCNAPLFKKENVLTTYDFIERILWDAIRVGADVEGEFGSGKREDYKAVASGLTPAAAAEISWLINQARKKISLNISPSSASETLMFGILEAKYKWQ